MPDGSDLEEKLPVKNTESKPIRDVLAVLAAVSFFGGSIYFSKTLPCEFNQAFFTACRYLWLPAAAAGVAAGVYLHRALRRDHGVEEAWAGPFLGFAVFALILLGSAGYVGFVNAHTGDRTPFAIEGTVAGRFRTGKNKSTHVLVIRSGQLDRKLKLVVRAETFRKTRKGDAYRTTMIRGGLGILYQETLDY